MLTSTSSLDESDSYLCKLLVVPPECESLLYIPMKPKNSFQVLDQHGYQMIAVELKAGENDMHKKRCVALLTPEGEKFQFFRSTGEAFATLALGVP